MDFAEFNWLAGFLEGEGSFLKGTPDRPNMIYIAVQSTDRDVMDRVSTIFGTKIGVSHRGAERGWKTVFMLRLRGYKAAVLMRNLRPLMGKRRQQQIDTALGSYIERYRVQKTTPLQREEITRRYNGGDGPRHLGREFGISHVRVMQIAKEAGIPH